MFGGELQILTAFLIDLLFGDPRKLPHPVKGIGFLAMKVEALLRNGNDVSSKAAGVVAVILVVGATVGVSLGLLLFINGIHSLLGAVVSVGMLYYSFAARDLSRHAYAVLNALRQGDLRLARENVGMMVGRDTQDMQEHDVARASVESVAENTVDGVTAPLFYALIFGPVGAIAYKSINTLDSMFGYKNERYIAFGWASAKLDDIVNYLPARLTVPVVGLAAWIIRLDGAAVFHSVARTAKVHVSPNAGYSEAAFAGALRVRLGGPRSYGGIRQMLPYLGVADNGCTVRTVAQAVRLMIVSAFLFLAFGLVIRLVVQGNIMWI